MASDFETNLMGMVKELEDETVIAMEIEAIKQSIWDYESGRITQDLLIIQLGNSMAVIKLQLVPGKDDDKESFSSPHSSYCCVGSNFCYPCFWRMAYWRI